MHRLACISAVSLALAAQAQTYTVTTVDLGPDIVAGWATGITENGRVFGTCAVEGGRRTFGFIWKNGAIEQLVVPQPGNFAVRPRTLDIHHYVGIMAMSDGGYYAGTGGNVNFGFSMQPYFAWIPSADPYPGQFVAAEDLGNTLVYGIADTTPRVTAVGAGSSTGNRRFGFISEVTQADDVGSPPRMTILTGFGGPNSPAGAYEVNDSGDVVGFGANATGTFRAFVRPRASGVMTDLGTLGGPSSDAYGISNSGHIVGKADVASGRPHAFLRAAGSAILTDLGTLGGATSSAHGVNNAGAAVGESWTAGGEVHATLWQGGQAIDLNTRIPAGSGWVLVRATGINDAGAIAGWGRLGGKQRAFLLAPGGCYADCNGDGVRNLADFGCFQTKFALGDPYADCNGDGVRNLADFGCFQTRFALGCP